MKKTSKKTILKLMLFCGIFLMISVTGFANVEANTGVAAWDKILEFGLKFIDFLVTLISIAGVAAILIMVGLEVFAPDMGRSTKTFITICIITAIALGAKGIIILIGGSTINPELIVQNIKIMTGV